MLASEFGLGKTAASYRIMIESLKRDLILNENCTDPQLKRINKILIEKLIRKAIKEMANLSN